MKYLLLVLLLVGCSKLKVGDCATDGDTLVKILDVGQNGGYLTLDSQTCKEYNRAWTFGSFLLVKTDCFNSFDRCKGK